ncbi:hypothetical protein DACRYDRAFT_25506 [Dacryopinax primogenitus]|uniref:Uncharacterized protein n=1 Tax=Dacryopinax primogenitus (strain DJM 731) TaxID=1858805 RepID=M5FQA6_DACPD|nr:uncharacterized protein DACRYDRAFT_25506 [Dacryopinax primogenitus]EJT96849.1 hypothetical protein DACRYDRAFT_25506 [Dacryopinax primogenitus]
MRNWPDNLPWPWDLTENRGGATQSTLAPLYYASTGFNNQARLEVVLWEDADEDPVIVQRVNGTTFRVSRGYEARMSAALKPLSQAAKKMVKGRARTRALARKRAMIPSSSSSEDEDGPEEVLPDADALVHDRDHEQEQGRAPRKRARTSTESEGRSNSDRPGQAPAQLAQPAATIAGIPSATPIAPAVASPQGITTAGNVMAPAPRTESRGEDAPPASGLEGIHQPTRQSMPPDSGSRAPNTMPDTGAVWHSEAPRHHPQSLATHPLDIRPPALHHDARNPTGPVPGDRPLHAHRIIPAVPPVPPYDADGARMPYTYPQAPETRYFGGPMYGCHPGHAHDHGQPGGVAEGPPPPSYPAGPA